MAVGDREMIGRASGGDAWLAKALERLLEREPFRDREQTERDARFVLDWKSGLHERDPGFARRMRVDFAGALEHSRKWHEALAKQAETERPVLDDPDNAPVALSYPDGFRWVWLRTHEARVVEGAAMGHCVGAGGYEHLSRTQSVFGLRDPKGVPRVTVLLDRCDIKHEASRGNSLVPQRYARYVADLAGVAGARLLLGLDPATAIPDGRVNFHGYGHDGTAWIRDGRIHRSDGLPAIEYWPCGLSRLKRWLSPKKVSREWWDGGRRHRDDAPAIVLANGDRHWWVGGRRHRSGGAAIEKANGDRQWWVDGRIHREGNPATIQTNGDRMWYSNGRLHRTDGPAIEQRDGHGEWCLNGVRHNADGPAIVRHNEDQEWWFEGMRHREGGLPAVDNKDLRREWWERRRRHRSDGPAIEHKNGDFEWYHFGLAHRIGGPAVSRKGTLIWFENGLRHREDGPAVLTADGGLEWWRKGRRHREDGPAVAYPGGSCEWWRDGVRQRVGVLPGAGAKTTK